jgi:hypothetical protein
MKAKESEDMRAPLFRCRLNFEKDFRNFQTRTEGPTLDHGRAQSPDLAYTKVQFQVTPQFQIRRLQVTGQDFSTLDFQFDQEKLNPQLDNKLFRFLRRPAYHRGRTQLAMAEWVLYADTREIHQQTASAGSEQEIRNAIHNRDF